MPQDSRFISSIDRPETNHRRAKTKSSPCKNVKALTSLSSNFIFWAKSWSLVGDVFVEFYKKNDRENLIEAKKKNHANDLKVSSEVLKELTRLKKNCNSDRANSGSSASSSGRDSDSSNYGRRQNRKGKSCHRSIDNHNNGASIKVTTKLADAETDMSLAASTSRQSSGSPERGRLDSNADASSKTISGAKISAKCGGIFRYLRDFVTRDVDHILSSALNCYEESRKAMNALPTTPGEVQSLSKKIGWVCNELGRTRLEARDIGKAETSFLKAIDAFNCVGDLTNIILILCNLGHGRRALAEDMVANSGKLRLAMLEDAYVQAIETAKSKYSEAIQYYGTAKAQLNALVGISNSVSSSLKKEVLTQFAHTYLRLGMLLSKENAFSEVYENCVLDSCCSFASKQVLSEQRKHTISANEAIREAISVYELLSEMRRQEAAYAYYQLASYQRDCCLRFLDFDESKQGENTMLQKVKQYASLAERNWQKSSDFYRPDTHPLMHLTILIDRTALSLSLTSHLHTSSLQVLETALTRLLNGRLVSETWSWCSENSEICARFWAQMQVLLKTMLATMRPTSNNKRRGFLQQGKSVDFRKLSELYKVSLKASSFSKLLEMHRIWTAQ